MIVTILMFIAGGALLAIDEADIRRRQRASILQLRDAIRGLSGKPPALRREVGRP